MNFRATANLGEPEFRILSDLSGKHRVFLAWLVRQSIIEFLERHLEMESLLPLMLWSEKHTADD